jgi:hypothetical protein
MLFEILAKEVIMKTAIVRALPPCSLLIYTNVPEKPAVSIFKE